MAPLPRVYGCPYPIWWTSAQYTIIILYLLAFGHAIYTLRKFIKNRHKETSKIKYAIFLGIISICTAAMLFILNMVIYSCHSVCDCSFSIWYQISIVSFLFTYALQNLLLLIIIFVKLESVFIGTIYRISNVTTKIYKALFIVLPLLMLDWPVGYLLPGHDHIAYYVGSMILFMVLLVHLSMAILIISKLLKVYQSEMKRSSADTNEHIIAAITKLTILSIMTLTTTLILDGLLLWYSITFDPTVEGFFIYSAFRLLDGYTTFLCTIMCYTVFKEDYVRACGCVDTRCRICWRRAIAKNNNDSVSTIKLQDVVTSASVK